MRDRDDWSGRLVSDVGESVPCPVANDQLRVLLEQVIAGLRATLVEEHDAASDRLRRAVWVLNDGRAAAGGIHGGLAPWQLKKVCQYIDTHLDQTIDNQRLAECTRLSRSYFARAFRLSTGLSPRAYLRLRRIARAQALMLSTDARLSDIALECGLADQSHLSRLFLQTVGVTPRMWRRARTDPDRATSASQVP
ncbi:MAG TPA: AraC family transcriptional regulator [Steroidobacter sp.]|uniref:AraC family transcriptional regulator n=1 Tax=Steroidobacter sp. TaxID=1978227 RepID=UPI002EDA7F82